MTGFVGIVFAVDGEVLVGRNMSNMTVHLIGFRSDVLQCFILFVYFYLCRLCYVDLCNYPFYCGIQVTQKANFQLMHLL